MENNKIIKKLKVTSKVISDHYTNYIRVDGIFPEDRDKMLVSIERALDKDEDYFRNIYIGTE